MSNKQGSNKKHILAACFASAILCACSSSITRTGYDVAGLDTGARDCSKIGVIKNAAFSQDEVEILGRVSALDRGAATKCSEGYVLNVFTQDACAIGADIVSITDESYPSFWGSSCYQAAADLIRLKDKSVFSSLVIDPRYSKDGARASSRRIDCITRSRMAGSFGLIGLAIAGGFGEDCQGLDTPTQPLPAVPRGSSTASGGAAAN